MDVAEFEAMPVVGVAEIARAVGIERRRLRRQLLADGVQLRWTGRRWVVHRAALRRLLPDFYEGVLERLESRVD